ncbi:hypothetical protein ACFLRY_02420 [Bacteroidota bacterium]
MIRRIFFTTLFVLIILTPLIMWLVWLLTPKKPMEVLIIDKTVLVKEGYEHNALNWVLTNSRITKKDRKFYDREVDYYGFFPLEDKKYYINDLTQFSKDQLDSMVNKYDVIYPTDMYGIYANEWYLDTLETERSRKVYGGLDSSDLYVVKKGLKEKKLVITEFNFLNHPTPYWLRKRAEKLLGFDWSGWVGRYFHSLDTAVNEELPHWVVNLYMQQHGNVWPFTKSGIVFVHESDIIVILENETHLDYEAPKIFTSEEYQDRYGIIGEIAYPFWFEIITPDYKINKVISTFKVFPNQDGYKELRAYGIPLTFPAAMQHKNDNLFYYFTGDFSDNRTNFRFVRFSGSPYVAKWMVTKNDFFDRNYFFWEYYEPLMRRIFLNYYRNDLKKN